MNIKYKKSRGKDFNTSESFKTVLRLHNQTTLNATSYRLCKLSKPYIKV